jgi:hypothetical protein
MTRDEATKELESYQATVGALFAILGLETMRFALLGPQVEAALGLPPKSLEQALVAIPLPSALSAYMAVLENAAKGQLAHVTPDNEWDEVIGDG